MKIKFLPLLLLLFLVACNKTEKIPGYTLIEKRFVKEVNADCYYFVHDKTGAKVFKIANDDPNKTFRITFKTLPEDDCGTPHILEHSVLNGSTNFPVKSPFDVLSKGSLNTFLNAMTSKDRTTYPAASLNEKDYYNLMHVYYDAVFNPLISENPQILAQEGWHYELNEPDEEITYKGVVYNEMQGAFSSPGRELYYQVNKNMFPNNTYGYSSGGLPEAITDLTYEKFLEFYNKYYHPSNSYIMFYGDADMKDELTFIDTAYLSKYTKSDIEAEVPFHEPFSEMKEVKEYYSVPEGSETNDQTYFSLNFVIGDGIDESMDMALYVLTDVLVNQESAPIRLALQKAGYGKNVEAWSYALRQHFLQMEVQKTNPEDASAIKDIIFNTLDSIATNGLDKEAVEGTINRLEFRLREGNDANKGITLSDRNLVNWIHAGDPFKGLEYEKPLADVKQALTSDYLEKIIKEQFIDNPYKLVLILEPKPGLEIEKSKQIKEKLSAFEASLSEYQRDSLVAATKLLIENQEKEDSPEALATIPVLSISDIDPEAEWFEVQQKELSGNTILHFDEFTNSIVYTQCIYNLKVLPQESIPWLGIYKELIGKLNTTNYSFTELEKALKIQLGGFSTGINRLNDYENNFELIPLYKVTAKATTDKTDKLLSLVEEIVLHTEFNDTARIETVLNKQLAGIENGIMNNGFGYTRTRLGSYDSESGLLNELTSGIEYYWFLKDLMNDFDNQIPEILSQLKYIQNTLFTKNNMVLGVTCSEDDYNQISGQLADWVKEFPEQAVEIKEWELNPEVKNEGFMTASKIQYVLQGANLYDYEEEYDGSLLVLNNIISSDWLHKELRVKGGAYGGFGYFMQSGEIFLGSYRDPNLKSTLDVFAQTSDFIKNYESDSLEFVRGIIGTMSDLDYPMTPSQKGNLAINRYLRGTTQEDVQKLRDEVLSTTIDDIHAFSTLTEEVLNKKAYCVYGNQETIENNKELFDEVIVLP